MTQALTQRLLLVFCAAMAALACHAHDGFAQAVPAGLLDYDVESSDWSGLRDFVELARAEGVRLEVSSVLDYSKLSPETAVIIVYPEQALDVANLSDFVVDGGRVFLADDFGQSTTFLNRLSLSRIVVRHGDLPHQEYVRDNTALPIFRPRGKHVLLEEIDALVANHPSVLINVGGPVVAYSEGGGLLYDMSLGKGKAIVLADSSMLINHMIGIADNAQLARNVLRYICDEAPDCEAVLVVKTWDDAGKYASDKRPPWETDRGLAERIDAFNETLRELMEDLPALELLYYLSILLAAGLGAYLMTIFPLRAPQSYSRYIAQGLENVPAPQTEFDWNMARFGRSSRDVNYALPVAILKEVFEEIFLARMGLWPSKSNERPGVEELGERFAQDFLNDYSPTEARRITREVTDLLGTLTQIPTRHRVFLDSDAYVSDRDLLRIYRRTMRILKIMGLEEEYERRTRSLV